MSLLFFSGLLAGVGCSSDAQDQSDTVTGDGQSDPVEKTVVGQYIARVDPAAAEPLRIDLLPVFDASNSAKSATVQSVLNDVTVSGPGVWHAATNRLTANVVITHNNAAAASFDEVRLVITAVTGTGAADAVFETASGGQIALADIQNAGSAAICASGVKTTATHALSIYTATGRPFSFKIDVVADVGGSSIRPDCDGDGFNDEVGQAAGDDCNDTNASISPYEPSAPTNPNLPAAGAACTCATSDSNAGTCGTSGGSCEQTLTSGTYQCRSNNTCECDINAENGSDIDANCNADCNVDCTGASDGTDGNTRACVNDCRDGADCDQTCSNMVSGTCEQTCRNNGTNCDLDCSNNAASSCTQDCRNNNVSCSMDCSNNPSGCQTDCRNGATCDITCDDPSGNCLYSQCTNADCSATCTGEGAACGMTLCNSGSDCEVTCGAPGNPADFDTVCGILQCHGNSTSCNVTCVDSADCYLYCRNNAQSCTMDCSAIPVAERAAKCDIICQHPDTKQEIGGAGSGIYACQ